MVRKLIRCAAGPWPPSTPRMSPSGNKRTLLGRASKVRFTPESGHSRRKNALDSKSRHPMSAITPKADVKWLGWGMSAFDPKRTFVKGVYPNDTDRVMRHPRGLGPKKSGAGAGLVKGQLDSRLRDLCARYFSSISFGFIDATKHTVVGPNGPAS